MTFEGHAHPEGDSPEAHRRAFLAHIRHELRTPLNAILGYSEMLLEDARDAHNAALDSSVSDLVEINEAGQRLLSLVNDMLDNSRLDGVSEEEMPVLGARVRQELSTPLDRVLALSARLLQKLIGDISPEAQTISPEIQKIRTAAERLQNLINDLTHFTTSAPHSGGPLHGVTLLSEVSATGQNGTAAVGGATTGQHGEENLAEIPDLVLDTLESLSGEHEHAGPRTGRILVVDDNLENRDLLERRLTRQGYQVTSAGDGIHALELVRAQQFDLLLLDLMMPQLNGYQVLEIMKADTDLRHLPVIMISALDEIESVARCVEIGAEDYLTKPFNPILLQARIDACLEKKRLRDAEVALREEVESNYEQLRHMESLRDSLTGMIVHDLRTPLTSFMGGIKLIGRTQRPTAPVPRTRRAGRGYAAQHDQRLARCL
jgi:CheY-like chemotaxis protein